MGYLFAFIFCFLLVYFVLDLIGSMIPRKQTYSVIVHHKGESRTVAEGLSYDAAIERVDSDIYNLFNPVLIIKSEK